MGAEFGEPVIDQGKSKKGYYGTIDACTVSEFFPEQNGQPGQYDIAFVCRALENAFIRAYDILKESSVFDFERAFFVFVDCFNIEFKNVISEEYYKKICEISVEGIKKLESLKHYQETVMSDQEEDKKRNYVDILIASYSEIVYKFLNTREIYNYKSASYYLNSFFELSREMVFKAENMNLASTGYRKSFFLRTLMSFAASRVDRDIQPKKSGRSYDYPEEKLTISSYYFSFFDPFAYDSIERALFGATKILVDRCRENGNETGEDLFELRKSMFVCSLESAFQRNITLDYQAYRIELDRHRSYLLANPVEANSSTSATKPIRLFEKTAAYICHNLPEEEEVFQVNITVIGHTGSSWESRIRNITDYLTEVLTWYDDLARNRKMPTLQLKVQNISNLLYKNPEDEENPKNQYKTIRIGFDNHSASCDFFPVDYE